jgi:hypothetical protein
MDSLPKKEVFENIPEWKKQFRILYNKIKKGKITKFHLLKIIKEIYPIFILSMETANEQYQLNSESVEKEYSKQFEEAKKHFKNIPDKWQVEWCERVQGVMSFSDFINGPKVKPVPLSAEARLEKWIESVAGLRLVAIFGRKRKEFNIENCPNALIESTKTQIAEDIKEENRIEKLSPENKQKEINELLKQLQASQGPGDALGMFFIPKQK